METIDKVDKELTLGTDESVGELKPMGDVITKPQALEKPKVSVDMGTQNATID
jgi:hypothetical protein